MERKLYAYALIKSLYDEGEDYLDAFWPFVISVIPLENFKDLESIQNEVRSRFGLEIPLHVLKTILNRAKKRGYIKQERKQYKLSEEGRKYLDKFETDKQVERRINALIYDISEFFNQSGTQIPQEEIYSLVLSFINKNLDMLIVEFINPSVTFASLPAENVKGYEKLLIDYIRIAEHRKPEEFNTLENLFFGSIISAILYVKDPSELDEIRKKFKNLQIFLDTNFVFSVLELHAPEFNEPAKELFNMLKDYGFSLKVFDFTVNEICRVINGYTKEAYRYPSSIAVDTIYSSLKRKGWTETDTKMFITNIDDILKENGIYIEWTGIDIDKYQPKNDELRNIIVKWKPDQPLSSQNHDLAAIEKIKEIRGHPIRKIENSKAIFLTSDVILSRLNFLDMGHKENATVGEVILDRLMACILWLKYPFAKLSVKSIIAVYSHHLFIKRRVWERFYESLKQLKQEGKVDDESISMLFYHNYIESVLREIDESEVEKITPEFVLEEIEKSAKIKKEAEEKLIKEKENEFLRRLNEEMSKKDQEKEREWLEKIEKIKRNLRKSAESKANRESNICVLILSLVVVGAIYVSYVICKRIGITDFWAIIVPSLLGSGGILGIVLKFRRYLKDRLTDRIYNQRLKELKWDDEF